MDGLVKVSVIIPCYNSEQLIDETLQSLERQTFSEFEVICINDGSSDGTLNKLKVWQEKGTLNLKILNQPNGGVSCARNLGIREAVGEFLLFLDADDCYCDSFITCLYSTIMETGADTAYCFYSRNYEVITKPVFFKEIKYSVQNQVEAMNKLLYRMDSLGFYCFIYRKDILTREEILFDVNTKSFEDREFNWKYLTHCDSAAMIEAELYWYRINPASVTQRRAFEWQTDDVKAALRTENYLKKHNCSFYEEVRLYLTARVLCGKLKNRALSRQKEDFKRLAREFNMKTRMRQVSRKDPSKAVRWAARLYLIHPMLFYYVVGLKNKRRGGKR